MEIGILPTAFGPIAFEQCPRKASRDEWENALKTAAQAAWCAGVDRFVYTRAMAQRDGVS